MGERFWRIGVLAHDGAYGQDHRPGGFISCTSEIGVVWKSANHSITSWGSVSVKKKSDLAFYFATA